MGGVHSCRRRLHASIPSTFNICSARATPLSLKLFGETDAVVPLPTKFYPIAMQLWRWILKLCTARESSVASILEQHRPPQGP